ncbi:MAG TPA: chemotaxis protein CheB [Nitrospira sp.]|nr:chemotaxis protein CheB [Nitrospira sp.]
MSSHRINNSPTGHPRHLDGINPAGIKRDIIVIGASAGGIPALQQIFAEFPLQMSAVVGVVLHRGVQPSHLAEVLGRRSALPVKEPRKSLPMRRGVIYLAPPDHHLLFEQGLVVIQRGPQEHSTRPAVDPLFRSAALAYGQRVVGLVLTGCGEDGVSGLIAITTRNGLSLTQDPDKAYMPYMPLNALRYDHVAGVVSLDEAAEKLVALAHGENVAVSVMAGR